MALAGCGGGDAAEALAAAAPYVDRFDRFDASPVRGTDGATTSFFSPDGQKIGFVSSAGELKTVSLIDGLVVTLAREASLLWGATWIADGRVAFVRRNALWTVSQDGGEPTPLTTLETEAGTVHAYPTLFRLHEASGSGDVCAVNQDPSRERPLDPGHEP